MLVLPALLISILQLESENARSRAEFYLEQKVDALIRVHSAFEKAKRTYVDHGHKIGHCSLSEDEVQEVISSWRALESAFNHASVFLSDQQNETLGTAFNAFHNNNALFYRAKENPEDMEPSDFKRHELLDTYYDAKDVLKEELNDPIKELIEN